MNATAKSSPSNPDGNPPRDRPLEGVRVLDLSQFLSGPFGTMILADMGAEIIKIEPPTGEISRTFPPHFVGEDSAYYLSINRNKRSVAVDLKSADGQAIVRELAAASDILVENFRPGVLARLGICYKNIARDNPRLIWCSVSGFGQDGPWRDWPAYDMIVQALSGGMSMTGERTGPPVRAGIPIGDLAAGMFGVIGILGALNRRHATGRGGMVDVAMLDCQIAMLCYQAAYYLHSGAVPGRQGSGHDSIATYRTFEAADGENVVVTANTEKMWQEMARVLGLAHLIADPRFKTNKDRFENRHVLWPLLEDAFRTRPADFWMTAFLAVSIPVAVVNTLDRALGSPQVAHRGMVMMLADLDGKQIRVAGNPLKFDGADVSSRGYPPHLGRDTEEVMRSVLGKSDAEIRRLLRSGALVQRGYDPENEAAAAASDSA